MLKLRLQDTRNRVFGHPWKIEVNYSEVLLIVIELSSLKKCAFKICLLETVCVIFCAIQPQYDLVTLRPS
jgi:hypothetical protein